MDWQKLNQQVIAEFRNNGGRVAQFGDLPVVILQTIGARTGRVLEVPLITVIDDNEMYLFGTNAGSKKQPVWIYNLRAHPEITVEFGSEKFQAEVVELDGGARADRIAIQRERSEQFCDYLESAAPRQVAVFKILRKDV